MQKSCELSQSVTVLNQANLTSETFDPQCYRFITIIQLVLLVKWINFTVTLLQFEIMPNLNQFDGSKFWWTDFMLLHEVRWSRIYDDVIHHVCSNACGTHPIHVCMSPLVILSWAKTWEPSSELKQFDGMLHHMIFTLWSSGATLPLVLALPTSPSPDIHAYALEIWTNNIVCHMIQIPQIRV